jgi:glycerophosphoryl diester phosphodiesterase
METPLLTRNSFKVIAHRGASGYAPENTLAAFQKAIDLGANMLEMDIHLSRDGEIVVIHDHTLERTTTGTGYVKDYAVKELKQFDAGKRFEAYRGETIPTLQEVFDLAKDRAMFAIEIKNSPVLYPDIENKLVHMIEHNDLVAKVIVIAFYFPSLDKIKRLNPAIQTGILYKRVLLEPWALAETVGANAIHPNYECTPADVVVEARKRGYLVHPWTINNPADIEQWVGYGVDGITSNYPDVLLNIVSNRLPL